MSERHAPGCGCPDRDLPCLNHDAAPAPEPYAREFTQAELDEMERGARCPHCGDYRSEGHREGCLTYAPTDKPAPSPTIAAVDEQVAKDIKWAKDAWDAQDRAEEAHQRAVFGIAPDASASVLTDRLRAAAHDERLSTGGLYLDAADEIDRLSRDLAEARETIKYLELFDHDTPLREERALRVAAEADLARARELLPPLEATREMIEAGDEYQIEAMRRMRGTSYTLTPGTWRAMYDAFLAGTAGTTGQGKA